MNESYAQQCQLWENCMHLIAKNWIVCHMEQYRLSGALHTIIWRFGKSLKTTCGKLLNKMKWWTAYISVKPSFNCDHGHDIFSSIEKKQNKTIYSGARYHESSKYSHMRLTNFPTRNCTHMCVVFVTYTIPYTNTYKYISRFMNHESYIAHLCVRNFVYMYVWYWAAVWFKSFICKQSNRKIVFVHYLSSIRWIYDVCVPYIDTI